MQQVDKGAIKFVLSGANIMCPGLTSPGAKMTEVPKDTVVVCNCSLDFSKQKLIFYFRQLWQRVKTMLWQLEKQLYQQRICKFLRYCG